jgi:hypothetical protein
MCFIGGVNNLLPSDFQPFLVTAQRPFFNTGIILNNDILYPAFEQHWASKL